MERPRINPEYNFLGGISGIKFPVFLERALRYNGSVDRTLNKPVRSPLRFNIVDVS